MAVAAPSGWEAGGRVETAVVAAGNWASPDRTTAAAGTVAGVGCSTRQPAAVAAEVHLEVEAHTRR